MLRKDPIIAIFNSFSYQNKNSEIKNYYKLLYMFTKKGFVHNATLESVYMHYPEDVKNEILLFENLDNLGKFVLEVCQEAKHPEAYILSAQDLNIGIEMLEDANELFGNFHKYGTVIQNPNVDSIKKGVFSKIFSK